MPTKQIGMIEQMVELVIASPFGPVLYLQPNCWALSPSSQCLPHLDTTDSVRHLLVKTEFNEMGQCMQRIWQMMLVLGCMGYHGAVPANSEIKFQRLELERGPTQSSIRDFIQDPDGYLWLGTQFSVDRFDGYQFRSITPGTGDSDSISSGFVHDMLLSQSGHIWVATNRGLDRVDPESWRVEQYRPEQLGIETGLFRVNINSLSESTDGTVYAISNHGPIRWNKASGQLEIVPVTNPLESTYFATTKVDHSGNIWLSGNNGLWLLNPTTDEFEPFEFWPKLEPTNPVSANNINITAIGNIVYVNDDGIFFVSKDSSETIQHLRPKDIGFLSDRVDAVASESNGKIWLVLTTGLLRIDPQDWQDRQFFPLSESVFLEGSPFRSSLYLEEIDDQEIWLSGHFGLALFDKRANTLQSFQHDPSNPYSIPPSLKVDGYRIFLDRFGVLWVSGSLGGLAYVAPHANRFLHVRDTSPNAYSLNIVRAIAEQAIQEQKRVWVSNQSVGISIWRRDAAGEYAIFEQYSIADLAAFGEVRRIVNDPKLDTIMWLVGSRGVGYINTETDEQTIVLPTGGQRTAVFSNPSTLWISRGDQVIVLNVEETDKPNTIHTFNINQETEPIQHFETFTILPLSNTRAIAVGLGGVVLLDLDAPEVSRFYPGGDPLEVLTNNVFSIAQTSDGTIWIGTRGGGLARVHGVHEGELEFEFITTDHGLIDNTIYAIAPDDEDRLWLSSNQGLMCYDPATGRTMAYGPDHGVQHHEFNNTVTHIGQSGLMYFGGINGWNVFNPQEIKEINGPPIVHLESIEINEQPLSAVHNHAVHNEDNPLTLSHFQNRLVFDFVGLHFASPNDIQYAYRLDGIDSDWIYVGTTRQARYPSLPPGNYAFEVKAANVDGIWSEPKQLFTARINKPPWQTGWAYLLYAAILIGMIAIIAWSVVQRRRQLEALVVERTAELAQQKNLVAAQASELEDALEARNIFFANISHEFRTPLTLIQASLNKLTRGSDQQAANTGQRYINRLLRLVEQLLDLSRLSTRDRQAKPVDSWRLDAVVEQIVASFQSLAKQKGLELSYQADGQWLVHCEQELVEKIVLNLLDNALKFTPEGGKIEVLLAADNKGVQLQVIDSGIGIPESEQEHLFERFFRAKSAETNRTTGAGVGLALVYEAVRSVGGQIRLESEVGKGSCFTVWLPAEQVLDEPGAKNISVETPPNISAELRQAVSNEPALNPVLGDIPDQASSQPSDQTVLIVEDNADLRAYLAEVLADQWTIIEAEDGVEGTEKARETLPDLIISDLMMPRADGFEMLHQLRDDLATSHIPVLFLTARQDEQTRLKAITLSADAFLEKPFNPEELKARLDQIAESRARLSNHLRKQLLEGQKEKDSTETAAHSDTDTQSALSIKDQKFLNKLNAWLEAHFDDPETSPQRISQALHITPRTLQRKIKALCNQTPAAYLRDYRLARARKLLINSDQTITQIAHACGFSSSQYFSRVFSKVVGLSPDQWRQKQSQSAVLS